MSCLDFAGTPRILFSVLLAGSAENLERQFPVAVVLQRELGVELPTVVRIPTVVDISCRDVIVYYVITRRQRPIDVRLPVWLHDVR